MTTTTERAATREGENPVAITVSYDHWARWADARGHDHWPTPGIDGSIAMLLTAADIAAIVSTCDCRIPDPMVDDIMRANATRTGDYIRRLADWPASAANDYATIGRRAYDALAAKVRRA